MSERSQRVVAGTELPAIAAMPGFGNFVAVQCALRFRRGEWHLFRAVADPR